MADKPFMQLNDRWRLAYDSRQWVIQQKAGAEFWEGRKFIGSTAESLKRSISSLDIELSGEAGEKLARLPATFGEFLEQQGIDRPRDDARSKRHHRERDRVSQKRAVSAGNKAPDSAISGKEAA